MQLSFEPPTLTLAETFTIAARLPRRGGRRRRRAPPRRPRRLRRGGADRALRRDGRVGLRVPRAGRAAARRRPVRARGHRGPPAPAPGEMAAKSALDAALHDLVGKLSRPADLAAARPRRRTPVTSFTIGIDSVDGTEERVREAVAAGYRLLKIKLGGPGTCRASRRSAARHRPAPAGRRQRGLDARDRARAAAAARAPRRGARRAAVPGRRPRRVPGLRRLGSGIPIVIDEGCHTLPDVAAVARYADGINIKLAKCGGLREALRMVPRPARSACASCSAA